MGFLPLLVFFRFGIGLGCSVLTKGLGFRTGGLGLGLNCFFWALFQAVEGASNFVIPNASQNELVSLRDCARSFSYLDWILISLQKLRPSVMIIPKS